MCIRDSKKGALLADIATPELDQQLAQAQADLATSEANASNAHTQAERYKGLVTSDAVSRQDTDTFVNQAASTSAAVRSAQANVQRLIELQGFEKIYAPFDGVVTARAIDTGQLINQGAANELFHICLLYTSAGSAADLRPASLPVAFSRRPASFGMTTADSSLSRANSLWSHGTDSRAPLRKERRQGVGQDAMAKDVPRLLERAWKDSLAREHQLS